MYLWRFSIAVTLALLWYFLDYGLALIQYMFFIYCLTTPVLLRTIVRECSTQTCKVLEETKIESRGVVETFSPYDSPDDSPDDCHTQGIRRYYLIAKSLQQVFECIYAQLVQPWYSVPEPCESQPLHQVLSKEFDLIIDKVISRAKDSDVCEAVVGTVRILTQHLRNAKKPEMEPLFSSRAEEIAVLRVFSEALVRNLFPESLWGLDVNRCALNEIVALKGLELMVKWLSDPDNLNQLAVNQLDSVTPKSSMEDLCGSDAEQATPFPCGGQGKASGVISENFEARCNSLSKSKKRAKKLKEGWSKFVDKMKPKKVKRKTEAQHVGIQAMYYNYGDVYGDSIVGKDSSIYIQQDSEREDGNANNYQPGVREDMEFKLSYEMWRVGQWTVCIPDVDWVNPELRFTVHLEEKHNPENWQWNIRKTHMDIINFRNKWQDSTNLPLISVPEEISEDCINDEAKEEYKRSVEHLLQEVVADNLIGHTQPVFQFLCPLDKLLNEKENDGGVWGLLSSIAYFLTPGQEDEEPCNPNRKAIGEDAVAPDADSTAITENCNESDARIPTVIISLVDPTSEPSDEEALKETQSLYALDSTSEGDLKNPTDNLDNSVTFELQMNKHLSQSQESFSSLKATDQEEQISPASLQHTSQDRGCVAENLTLRSVKLQKHVRKLSCGLSKIKVKDQKTLPKREDGLKNQASWEQHDATKAIFDLVKEISGNSILLSILKPVISILRKKVNSFLDKMNLTEMQMATYIDTLCAKLWPDGCSRPSTPPRTAEEKIETRARAHHLFTSKYSNNLILKKTDVETVFKAFQNSEQNKNLMLLSAVLREFLPGEAALNKSATVLLKVNNYDN